MSNDADPRVLIEAKDEYTKQLMNLLIDPIFQRIKLLYQTSQLECDKIKCGDYLKSFQLSLKQIPKWNQDIIDKEYNKIASITDSDWLDKLVQAVFLANAKILSSVRLGKSKKKVQINIPTAKVFTHKCYIETARSFYQNPFLFSHKVTEKKQLKNQKIANEIIKESIEEAIRKLVPIRDILNEYLKESSSSSSSLSEESSNESKDELPDMSLNNSTEPDDEQTNIHQIESETIPAEGRSIGAGVPPLRTDSPFETSSEPELKGLNNIVNKHLKNEVQVKKIKVPATPQDNNTVVKNVKSIKKQDDDYTFYEDADSEFEEDY